ncbi:hypothetical protein HDU81_002607 [Chytriomyces hyalinus]|nr:hypothetical protein HDU81_002607 [Chytriomyces hyalinus]
MTHIDILASYKRDATNQQQKQQLKQQQLQQQQASNLQTNMCPNANTASAAIDNLHPGVARDQINQTNNMSEVASSGLPQPPAQEKKPVSEDMYPAGIRAIENMGSQEQVSQLHKMEQGGKN